MQNIISFIGLFCKRNLSFKEPTNRSHPMERHAIHRVRCNILQHTATNFDILQHSATPCNTLQHRDVTFIEYTATHSNRQHTATHCNTLQHTATHCNTLQHNAAHCSTLQHTATHINPQQHTATHSNTQQHTATQHSPHTIGNRKEQRHDILRATRVSKS